ncbi:MULTISPECIES: hypothetical protein [Turicibacter]|uniref:hypothetical protein n=2 Tax=Turicibacteraceae TaxID=2810281 RepID=UPI0001FD94F2|nr:MULTISPECIES: hypothetical protein [Turicibacter]EGC91819.1 putative lipoprotein [Turicibacter sp. HGF1]MCU7195653.1 hypothetical protein [Turicibacter sanguinis]
MKKIVMTTVSAMVLVGLVGCGFNIPTDKETPKQEVAGEGTTVSSGENETADFQNVTQVYGKVKSIIGNEIEVSLAKNPFELSEEELEALEGEIELEGGMEIGQAVTVTDSIAAMPSDGEGGNFSLLIGEQEPLELGYTGETKSFTIPTGTTILNYLTGGEGSINDIKEGSVIAIAMDGEEDNQKVFAVDIME